MGFLFIGAAVLLFFFFAKKNLSAFQDMGASSGTTKTGPTLNDLNEEKINKYGLDRNFVRAIIKVESNGNTKAYSASDPSYGLMQITPILAATYGYVKDHNNPTSAEIALLFDVSVNSEIGCRYIRYLLDKYKNKEIVIQMYNLGESGYLSGKRNPEYLKKVLYWDYVYHLPWDSAERAKQKLFVH